jgi:CRP/FNR family transcriptional regulator, anaerobic regulatory protein
MYSGLLSHINRFVSLNEDEEELLISYLSYRELKKKAWLLKEGQVCTANYFIAKGCLRMYSVAETNNEQIVQFGIDNWWLTNYMSLDRQQPSLFYIQAIEPTQVIVLNSKIQDELFEKLPQLERYFRVVLQRSYAASIMRIHYMHTFSGEERYHHFSNLFPEFVQRIPQYMLASYLGFTPEFLSKIRGRSSR